MANLKRIHQAHELVRELGLILHIDNTVMNMLTTEHIGVRQKEKTF